MAQVKVATTRFGVIEVDGDRAVEFPGGLLGFEGERRFVLLETGFEGGSFMWLQSMSTPGLCFLVVNPFHVYPGYEPDLPSEDLSELGIESLDQALVLAIMKVPEDVERSTVNLQAPLVINPRTRMARQVVALSERYGRRHFLFAGS